MQPESIYPSAENCHNCHNCHNCNASLNPSPLLLPPSCFVKKKGITLPPGGY